MNLENVKIGDIYKNYGVLCAALGEPVKNGCSKKSQLKKWQEYFSYERIGKAYKITDIQGIDQETIPEFELVEKFGTAVQKKAYAEKGKLTTAMRNSLLNKAGCYYDIDYNDILKQYEIYETYETPINCSIEYYLDMPPEHYKSKGVYKLQDKNNNVYIGSTVKSFRSRMLTHKAKVLPTSAKIIENGGKMSILWLAPDNATEQEIRNKEEEFIIKFSKMNDIVLFNMRWNSKTYKQKNKIVEKFISVKISETDYDKAIELLSRSNIKFKERK